MNNALRDSTGRVLGYRCSECGHSYQSMWGNICNGCREKERRHQESLAAMRGPQTVDVAPAIAGVLAVLPHPGTHWPDVEKAKFMAALGAVLDVVYPEPVSAGEKP